MAAYKNEDYLILVNHDNKDFRIPKYLEEIDANSGSWVAIISELDLPVKAEFHEQIKNILPEIDNATNQPIKIKFDEACEGSNFSLKDLFFEISLYKIKSKFENVEKLHQLIGAILTKSNSYRLLPYSDRTIKMFEEVFECDNEYIPFDSILASYVASDFKFAYLDLYRCIESLESVYSLYELYQKLSFSENTTLLKFCETIYGTKAFHRLGSHIDFLAKLIKAIDSNSYENFKNKNIIKKPEQIYEIRNMIAHLNPTKTKNQLPEDISAWDDYIFYVLWLVKILYDSNQNLFKV